MLLACAATFDADRRGPAFYFEPNLGQARGSVQFVSRAVRSPLYLMADGGSVLQTPPVASAWNWPAAPNRRAPVASLLRQNQLLDRPRPEGVVDRPEQARSIRSRRTARWFKELLPALCPVQPTLDSVPPKVLYAGSAPQLIARAIQVNVRIPVQAMPCGVGDVPVVLLFGGVPSQERVTISVR